MGHFVEGVWHSGYYKPDAEGRFVRPATTFRHPLQADGDYHLYVSYACPWAHRTLVGRALLGLEERIGVSVVDPISDDNSWKFTPDKPGCTEDALFASAYLREVYLHADNKYTGRITVPILWDRRARTIANNESREILRGFSILVPSGVQLAPPDLRERIDETIDAIYEPINNGVYRAGFATSQAAYEEAADGLFAALDRWESFLGTSAFLCGPRVTEADICMFTTLLRFDPVYHTHFKCSRRRLADYPNLWAYLRSLYQLPGVKATCNLEHIRQHYYRSHPHINPTGIVAQLPEGDLEAPHDRYERFGIHEPLAQGL